MALRKLTAGNRNIECSRIDVWLWRARFFKSRALSTKTVRGGDIRLCRGGKTQRINKPNTQVRPGDVLTFFRGDVLFHIEVTKLGVRRGPAPEAQTLYLSLLDASPAQKRA